MSSGESDNEDIPEVAICKKLCEEFAEITETDTACAQFYLQDRKWNLEQSVNDFFEDRKEKEASLAPKINKFNQPKVVVVKLHRSSEYEDPSASRAPKLEYPQAKKMKSNNGESAVKSNNFKFITWNIDGLNEKNLKLRTKAVCKHIISEQADVVFLQEIIPETAQYLEQDLTDYHIAFGGEEGYFVATLLKKASIKLEDTEVLEFPATRMMRNILKVNASYCDKPLCLMNSHLESTADGADERKEQLQFAWQKIINAPKSSTVIFAGDLNLRDKEVTELGGLPKGIEDMWVKCGSRKECSYTFDLLRNDNLIFNGRFKPRCRFDRVFTRASAPANFKPSFFGLIGLERLLPHRCFPSDHWGILCHFEVE